jgi:hypothetical protein
VGINLVSACRLLLFDEPYNPGAHLCAYDNPLLTLHQAAKMATTGYGTSIS